MFSGLPFQNCNELSWWQIGSFGAITRILNIVPKREDLLKVAVAGPLAGFGLGFILLLLGLILPPSDGIGVVVDASVFHESFLAGGIGKHFIPNFRLSAESLRVNAHVHLWRNISKPCQYLCHSYNLTNHYGVIKFIFHTLSSEFYILAIDLILLPRALFHEVVKQCCLMFYICVFSKASPR